MKTAIVYATKYGSTKKAAEIIAEKLSNCTLIDIHALPESFDEYDCVILGSYVHMGVLQRDIRAFTLGQIRMLLQKKLGIFVCCAFPENAKTYFNNNIPPQLLKHASACEALGGEFDRSRLKGMDRMVARMVLKADHAKGILRTFSLHDDKIEAFVDKLTDGEATV